MMLDAHSRTAYGSALAGTFGVEEAHITEAPGTHSEKVSAQWPCTTESQGSDL